MFILSHVWGCVMGHSLCGDSMLQAHTVLLGSACARGGGLPREKRDLERKCQENIETQVKVVCCVHSRLASTVDSVLRSDAVQNKLCWLAWYVHNGPPSPKFQILPSQPRQTADRAASLSIIYKGSLGLPVWWMLPRCWARVALCIILPFYKYHTYQFLSYKKYMINNRIVL